MVRNYLKGRHGNRINGVVAAAGYNFRPLLRCVTAAFARCDRRTLSNRRNARLEG